MILRLKARDNSNGEFTKSANQIPLQDQNCAESAQRRGKIGTAQRPVRRGSPGREGQMAVPGQFLRSGRKAGIAHHLSCKIRSRQQRRAFRQRLRRGRGIEPIQKVRRQSSTACPCAVRRATSARLEMRAVVLMASPPQTILRSGIASSPRCDPPDSSGPRDPEPRLRI